MRTLDLTFFCSCSVVHLDLKPSNVFMKAGRLKIGDFGMAVDLNVCDDVEREGDRNYIAPETLNGLYGKPADVFSLGLIMIEITANCVLPEGGDAWQKLRRGDLSDVPFEDTSNEMISLIRVMLDHEPELRPNVEQLMLHGKLAGYIYHKLQREE